MTKKKPSSIEEYIADAAPAAKPHLQLMYDILRKMAPQGTGSIKWGVPIFWQNRVLFGFAAYQAHLSFGPGKAAVEHFSKELEGYKVGTDTIQFPYNQPLPTELVQQIAAFCLANSQEKGA